MNNNQSSTIVAAIMAICFLPSSVGAQQHHFDAPSQTTAAAQENVPAPVQRAEAEVEQNVKRFRVGVQGGVGLDPEILDVGVHAAFGPIFKPNVEFRPGIEIGAGEITTLFGINLDVLYTFPGSTRESDWIPYVGAGPSFGLSHRGFETDDADNVEIEGPGVINEDARSRFDFSDTDFNGGMNFIVGMRKQNGLFFEMKATAWGVSNIRLLLGFNF